MEYKSIEVLDTTLRDGTQGVNVSFSLKDKLRLASLLDQLGVDYIEGGWPSSNPKDADFFKEVRHLGLNSKVAAFGSTRRKGMRAEKDPSLNGILDADVQVGVIFGKSWSLHAREVLNVALEENLEMVYDSVKYLKDHGLEVIFDAEHFYQGFLEDQQYALNVLKTARDAGADVLVLADTNGGTPPHLVYEVTSKVRESVDGKLGLHMHNDAGCAVANTLLGLKAGARHIQGTINGLGERTGNADLVQVIPTLALKMGFGVLRGKPLSKLRDVSLAVYEMLGLQPNPYQPYVGENAFAHKAGVHADAVLKNPRAYEHVDPVLVGNSRKVVISELSGSSNLLAYAEIMGLTSNKRDERLKMALEKVKEMERKGYSFDLAPASAMLVMMREFGNYRPKFKVDYWKVTSEGGLSVAVVKVNGVVAVAEGNGPVNAVDKALREAMGKAGINVAKVKLVDYRVHLPGAVRNTESVVRVLAQFSDGVRVWGTTGVSANVIEASVEALVDGLDYFLQTSKS